MKLQDLPKTAAEAASGAVKLPVELVTKAREAVEKQFGGGSGAEVKEPAVESTKVKGAQPTAKPKKKPAAKRPAAAKRAKPATKNSGPTAVDRAQGERRKLENGGGAA
jgi:hypothetical protein